MESKKKISLPVKIIIIGCIIGLIVAAVGFACQIKAKKTNENRRQSALKASEEAVAQANARLAEIEKEYNQLKTQLEAKASECDKIDNNMLDPNWHEKTLKCQREKSEINSEINNLKMEDTAIKNKDYTGYYQLVKPMSYQIYYIIGASIVGAALLGAFIIYLVKGEKTY